MTLRLPLRLATCAAVLVVLAAGCDSGFEGDLSDNRPPETELSVRSVDLRDDLGDRRLVSTVALAWSGTDADGVVASFEARAYVVDAGLAVPGPEEGWGRTTRRDSTILLPIPEGRIEADVAVEVRAIDDDGTVDPTSARTIFPIINSVPTFQLSAVEAPPDTTWPVLSFAFAAVDRDGEANLAGIEIALNDTTAGWTRLAPDVTFVTLVAEDPSATVTNARVFVGRGFQNAALALPGLALDASNTVFLRAVDAAGATSATATYPDLEGTRALFVRRVTSPVLLVNDLRTGAGTPDLRPLDVARNALGLHGTAGYDTWDLSATPLVTASPRTSEALPVTADPTLRQTLALWTHIYWVSNAVTNSPNGNNLPLAATVMASFFDRGGRLMVQTPITPPLSGDEGQANAAIDVLPMSGLVSFAGGVRTLRANAGTVVSPVNAVPGTSGAALPPLVAASLITTALPYDVGADDVPLYRMPFTAFFTSSSTPPAPWTGSQVVASIRADRRAALFALPLFAGSNALFGPAPGQSEGVVQALAVLLDGLDFPASNRFAFR